MTDFQLDTRALETLIESLDDREPSDSSELSLAFVGDETMRDLHEQYYGEPGTTDVLTFDYGDETLEIVLNPYQHQRQAADANNTLPEETAENVVHGYLHGQGYDHTEDDGEHLSKQRQLMNELDPACLDVVTEADE
jgi:rRNA maturation RNase YbeY